MNYWLGFAFMVLQCVFNYAALHRLSELEKRQP